MTVMLKEPWLLEGVLDEFDVFFKTLDEIMNLSPSSQKILKAPTLKGKKRKGTRVQLVKIHKYQPENGAMIEISDGKYHMKAEILKEAVERGSRIVDIPFENWRFAILGLNEFEVAVRNESSVYLIIHDICFWGGHLNQVHNEPRDLNALPEVRLARQKYIARSNAFFDYQNELRGKKRKEDDPPEEPQQSKLQKTSSSVSSAQIHLLGKHPGWKTFELHYKHCKFPDKEYHTNAGAAASDNDAMKPSHIQKLIDEETQFLFSVATAFENVEDGLSGTVAQFAEGSSSNQETPLDDLLGFDLVE